MCLTDSQLCLLKNAFQARYLGCIVRLFFATKHLKSQCEGRKVDHCPGIVMSFQKFESKDWMNNIIKPCHYIRAILTYPIVDIRRRCIIVPSLRPHHNSRLWSRLNIVLVIASVPVPRSIDFLPLIWPTNANQARNQ